MWIRGLKGNREYSNNIIIDIYLHILCYMPLVCKDILRESNEWRSMLWFDFTSTFAYGTHKQAYHLNTVCGRGQRRALSKWKRLSHMYVENRLPGCSQIFFFHAWPRTVVWRDDEKSSLCSGYHKICWFEVSFCLRWAIQLSYILESYVDKSDLCGSYDSLKGNALRVLDLLTFAWIIELLQSEVGQELFYGPDELICECEWLSIIKEVRYVVLREGYVHLPVYTCYT